MNTLKFAAAFATLCCTLAAEPTTQPSERTTPSGLKIIEVASAVPVAKAGDTVYVLYTGILQATNVKFDSSMDHGGEPINFVLGEGKVIKGWDEGIAGMKVGDKRKLIVPSGLAYGQSGAGERIPANATLIFDVELVRVDHPRN